MNYTTQFLFFFGAIGVFNSFLLGIYFVFFRKKGQQSDVFFGFFLLFLSERAFRALVYFFSDKISTSYGSFDPLSFMFIGPFLFLYVLSALDITIKKTWKYHILIWLVTAVVLFFAFPFTDDAIFWKKYILRAINLQWLVYIILSGYLLFIKYKEKQSNKVAQGVIIQWLRLLLLGVLLLWLIYFFISFSYFIVGSITFSILFYSFFLYLLFNKRERHLIFNIEKKYADKKIGSGLATELMLKLKQVMEADKPYKSSGLKSSDIAKKMEISTHQLSQLLNDNYNKSFSVFINEYRVEEAKLLIQSNTKFTLDAIGNESGFNSKSTFYTVFKRVVGMTPAKYKEQL